jgi:DNA repair exonuclease SbcCD ATPase subunit
MAEAAARAPCLDKDEYSRCPFLLKVAAQGDDIGDLRNKMVPPQVTASQLDERTATARSAEDSLRRKRTELQGHLRKIEALQADASKTGAAKLAKSQLDAGDQQLATTLAAIDQRAKELREDLAAAKNGLRGQNQRLPKLEQAASQADKLAGEINQLEASGLQMRARHEELQSRERQLLGDVARAEQQAHLVEELRSSIGELAEQETQQAADLADWQLIQRGCGRDGVQALEIDAAGPELRQITNDLTRSSFGSRFDVKFITSLPRARGNGEKEVFEVLVIDYERGWEGPVEHLSGGEKVLVGEAVSLGLAMYVARHGGRRFETGMRDETSGSLDPETAEMYPQMLRAACEIAGCHQLLFVSHQPAVWEQADTVLQVGNGRVTVLGEEPAAEELDDAAAA